MYYKYETMKYEQSNFPETTFKKYDVFVMNKEEDVEYSIDIDE